MMKIIYLQVSLNNVNRDTGVLFSLGEMRSVLNTEYNFQKSTSLGEAIPKARQGEGFCVNYCVGDGKANLRL